MEEAKKINKSLSALGLVINSLTDGRSQHTPYRDSKLTRILQESLGGNSRTTLIITCNQSLEHSSETISTLRFGVRFPLLTRAKKIKNNAKVNLEPNPTELKQLLKESREDCRKMQARIIGLNQEIEQWRSGKTVTEKDRFKYSTDSVVVATASGTNAVLKAKLEDILEKHNVLEDELVCKENQIDELNRMLKEAVEALEKSVNENSNLQQSKQELELKVQHHKIESKDSEIIIESLKQTIATKDQSLCSLEVSETKKGKINELEVGLKSKTANVISSAVMENRRISDIISTIMTKAQTCDAHVQTDNFELNCVETQTDAIKTMTRSTSALIGENDKSTGTDSQLSQDLDLQQAENIHLTSQLLEKEEEIASLKLLLSEHVEQNESLQKYFYEIVSNQGNSSVLESQVKKLQKDLVLQAADFDAMRNKLMSDLTTQ